MRKQVARSEASWVDNAPVELEPLECLLAAIIDAHPVKGKKRGKRLRDAYECLTGLKYDRIHEPDSDIGQAVFEYGRLDDENRWNQVRPEHGGPEIKTPEDEEDCREKSKKGLAGEVAKVLADLDKNGNLEEYLYKLLIGTYSDRVRNAVEDAILSDAMTRFASYDAEFEKTLCEDMCEVAKILAKYGIATNMNRPFWRVPKT